MAKMEFFAQLDMLYNSRYSSMASGSTPIAAAASTSTAASTRSSRDAYVALKNMLQSLLQSTQERTYLLPRPTPKTSPNIGRPRSGRRQRNRDLCDNNGISEAAVVGVMQSRFRTRSRSRSRSRSPSLRRKSPRYKKKTLRLVLEGFESGNVNGAESATEAAARAISVSSTSAPAAGVAAAAAVGAGLCASTSALEDLLSELSVADPADVDATAPETMERVMNIVARMSSKVSLRDTPGAGGLMSQLPPPPPSFTFSTDTPPPTTYTAPDEKP